MNNELKWVPWVIVAMSFVATALSFLDRQVLSFSILKIKEDFRITDIEYGFINTGFLISYAIMFSVGGILIDRFGSRFGLGWSVGIWSFATMLHSIASNALHFGIFRFFLGLGEGGAFPGAIKAVVEWIPKNRHALATGITIGGSALGAVIAPPLCVYLMNVIGWRGVFLVTSGIGFIWVLIWFLLPKNKNRVGSESDIAQRYKHDLIYSLVNLIKYREVWVFMAIRFLLDPIFYFYMFWIPKYLHECHGTNIRDIGNLFWIPFFAMGLSNMLGGVVSDWVYKKTSSLNYSRKIVMGIAAVLTLPALLVSCVPSFEWVIVILTIVLFAHGLWITNYITSISDIFGKFSTSSIVGFSGTAGAVSAFVLNPVIGFIVTRFSYDLMWFYAGFMYIIAFLLFVLFIPVIKPKMEFI